MLLKQGKFEVLTAEASSLLRCDEVYFGRKPQNFGETEPETLERLCGKSDNLENRG
jgi:hypothetical protein